MIGISCRGCDGGCRVVITVWTWSRALGGAVKPYLWAWPGLRAAAGVHLSGGIVRPAQRHPGTDRRTCLAWQQAARARGPAQLTAAYRMEDFACCGRQAGYGPAGASSTGARPRRRAAVTARRGAGL